MWPKKNNKSINLLRPHDAKPTNLANDALFAGLLAAEPEGPLPREAAGLLVVDEALTRLQKAKNINQRVVTSLEGD